jgi:hypothetical protein
MVVQFGYCSWSLAQNVGDSATLLTNRYCDVGRIPLHEVPHRLSDVLLFARRLVAGLIPDDAQFLDNARRQSLPEQESRKLEQTLMPAAGSLALKDVQPIISAVR